jgi:multiple antibiotic resistance protein
MQKLEGFTAIVLSWLVTATLLVLSGRILSLLGEKGTTALTRLMGTILILLAVQMILNGITHYITTLQVTP